MLERNRVAAATIAVALAACVTPYTAPVVASPVVITRDAAARVKVLVQSVIDQEKATSPHAASTAAANAIAAQLRQASFQVTMDPKVPAPVVVKVGYLKVFVEAHGAVVDQFGNPFTGGESSQEYAEFGKHALHRLERSEAVASIAAELADKPQPPSADAARPWAKTTGAAATRRLAVLEFRGALAPNLLAILSDQARAAAVEAVRPHGIAVMTRENTAVMLRDQGRNPGACAEGDCEVETARLIGAHLVVTGEVSRVGSAQFLQMKLFDAEAGTLLASKQADAADDLALVKAAKPAAAALFE